MPLILDGTTGIVANNIADYAISTAKLANSAITSAKMGFSGAVLQVIQTTTATSVSTSSTSTWSNTTLSASITPSSSSSKVMVLIMQEVQVWNQANYATGMWQLLRGATVIYTPSSTDNGNIFAYDYGNSGINVYRPTPIMWLDSPNTTSSTTYYTQIKKGSNGGQVIGSNSNSPGSITLMEIAG